MISQILLGAASVCVAIVFIASVAPVLVAIGAMFTGKNSIHPRTGSAIKKPKNNSL